MGGEQLSHTQIFKRVSPKINLMCFTQTVPPPQPCFTSYNTREHTGSRLRRTTNHPTHIIALEHKKLQMPCKYDPCGSHTAKELTPILHSATTLPHKHSTPLQTDPLQVLVRWLFSYKIMLLKGLPANAHAQPSEIPLLLCPTSARLAQVIAVNMPT